LLAYAKKVNSFSYLYTILKQSLAHYVSNSSCTCWCCICRDMENTERVEKDTIHQDHTQLELTYLIRLHRVLLGRTHPHRDRCPQDSTPLLSTPHRQRLEHILQDPMPQHLIQPVDRPLDLDIHQIQVTTFMTSRTLKLV